ncbi:transglycosylase domain-containing protein [Paenibacillus methanolicus]|uniref:Penicillin-binding protein 2A n=1 Tax=Paenibacillus methanolicus TaxID=582686 RepID=A0A5S5CI54_9BACL|nr:PBP1A family penicillin-binding protein [Paenibacillus methanolicus]TYP79476.1 penicillin-binding protein 2A [Paenibacillus methanolicus]
MREKQNRSAMPGRTMLARVGTLLLAGSVISGAAGFGAFKMMVAAQDVSTLSEPLHSATVIMDKNGKEASRVSLNKVEPATFAELPEHLVAAVVAVEDKRFFEHDGADLRSISRAVYANLNAGGKAEGGSTITQQLAKNVFLSHEKTWTRKWNELLLAQKIETEYGKEQIFELYMNHIYFGEGAWGIKRAASVYFGKGVKQLTLAESALLAGIIKAPSALTPKKHPEEAKTRRNIVLDLMKEQGRIDAEQYAAAIMEPIKLLEEKPDRTEAIRYPYYVDEVIREATEVYGLSEEEVLHGGLRIYTALDPAMQQAVERTYANEELFPASAGDQLIQSAAVLVDPRDGSIRALVGGRGEAGFRSLNRATQMKRQPGSTMKPIAVYAPALEKGRHPGTIIVDEPVDFGGYSPKNADGQYHGAVTLYDALIHSYNVPAVKTLNEIGIEAGIASAKKFGLALAEGDRALGLALGGLQEGVSPLAMAEAFGALASSGSRNSSYTITRIENESGDVLASRAETAPVQAVSSETARTMTAMLEGVVREGTGKSAALEGRPVAGKTGTTQMPGTNGDGAKDNWFVGYTPQLAAAVWLGYDRSDADHYLTTTSKAAAAVFRSIMTGALANEPVLAFQPVSGVPPIKPRPAKQRQDEDEDEDEREVREWLKELENHDKKREQEFEKFRKEIEKKKKNEWKEKRGGKGKHDDED